MFCSNCGRSVTINDVTCPHCKVRLGNMLSGERFPGNVFTSTQLKLAPDKKGDLSGIVSVENMGSHQNEDNVYSGTAYRAAFAEPAEEERDEAQADTEPAQDPAEEAPEEKTEEITEETAEEVPEEEEIPEDILVYEDDQTDEDEETVEIDEDEERVFDDEDEDEETEEDIEEDIEEDDASDDDEIDPFEEDRVPVKHTKKQISPEFLKTMEEMKANMAAERKPRSMLWGTLPFGKNRTEAPAEPKHAKKDAPIEEVLEPEAAEPEDAGEIFEEVSEEVFEEVSEEVSEEVFEEVSEDVTEEAEEAVEIEETIEEITEEAEAEDAEAEPSPVKKLFSFFKKKEKANEKAEDTGDVTIDDDLVDAEEELTEEEETAAAETEADDEEEAPELEELKDEEADETDEKKGFDLKAMAAKIGSNNIVKYIIYAAAGVLIIVGIVSWLKNVSAQSSNIAGVTHSVYNDAIAKMTAFVRQENVDMLTQTASANESYAKELMEEDREAITSLLPDAPMESDEVFLAAVANIHKAAEDVIGKDGAAIYEGKAEERKAASEQEWGIINEAVAGLKEANTATQVTSISVNLQNMIMPAPTATPEPVVKTVTYSTLREGMSDNDDVAKLQSRLIRLGYLDGEADGDFGPKTTNAIKSFQNAVGMTADGVAGAELQEKLYADDAPKADK